ncbi:MAG TPA: hypothetical protein VHC23_14080 [Jatrophihabitans sp.]|nr:hypothetical protein [Jatrophihabitans sp.]
MTVSGDERYPETLEIEVEAELELVESSSAAGGDALAQPWAFDPVDIEREEIGLRNVLGAAEAIERTELDR